MSILSKSTALTLYESDFIPTTDDLLRAAFAPIDTTAATVSFGFVNADDYLDPAWAKSPPQKGRFTAFSFRVDTRRIPGAVLQKKYRIALEAEQAKRGKKFIPKEAKREIKEQVQLGLLAGSEPVPAAYDVVVDPDSRFVYLASSSKNVKERFENHWAAKFQSPLVELTPEELSGDREALPQSFLTHVFNDGLTLEGGGLVIVPNKATLTSAAEGAVVALEVSGGTELPTLSAPLEDGRVVKATLLVEIPNISGDFVLTIRAADFGITGLKTPQVQADNEDLDGAFLEKMYLLERVCTVLHQAYRVYLTKSPPAVVRKESHAEDF